MNYGIPYMGSKSKIAASICMNLPKADHFYDLFGGGFSITHYMMIHRSKHYKYFHFNEINSDIVELIKKAISGYYNYNVFKPEWISREDFFKYKDTDAYIRCLWSFGNNQKSYLFGDVEPYKKSMHQAIVFNEFDDMAAQILGLKKWPISFNSINKRRLYLKNKITLLIKTNKLPKMLNGYLPERLERLQQLEQLERLQQLEQLERLQQLQFTALDYESVSIELNSIIYCDIPYLGTCEYINKFNHKRFYDWASSQKVPVFISEYSLPDSRFTKIYQIDKRSLLSSDKTVGNKNENLYWNKVISK